MSMTGPAEEFESKVEGKNKIKKLKSILKNRKLHLIALFANLRKPGPAKQFIQVLQASKAVHSARRLAPRSKNNNRRCSPFANLLPLSLLRGRVRPNIQTACEYSGLKKIQVLPGTQRAHTHTY